MKVIRLFVVCCTLVTICSPSVSAQTDDDAQAFATMILDESGINWKTEGVGRMKHYAEIEIPEGYVFTESKGAVTLMDLYGNLPTGMECGLIAPKDFEWCVLFEFEDIGYVEDGDKDALNNPSKLLKTLQKNQRAANKRLRELGMPELEVVGWELPPFYNEETNNLEWALRLTSDTGDAVNLNTKLLGRRGVMNSILICDADRLAHVMDDYQQLLAGYEYKKGQSYAEFREGDKTAEYALTGLIVGGGAVAAWKFGPKLFAIILPVLVAVGAGIKRFFGFGRE